MEKYILKEDLKTFYVTAKSFPGGVQAAYNTLIQKLPDADSRTFIGFSCPNGQGIIIYNAATIEKYEGEGNEYGLPVFVIPRGEYVMETITNWKKKEATVEHTFRKLVRHANAVCPCIEMYEGDDMVCMVKIGPIK